MFDIEDYNREHTSKDFINYEKYKIFMEKFINEKEKYFWYNYEIPILNLEYNKDLDYDYELSKLTDLWYEKYCKNFKYRTTTYILEQCNGKPSILYSCYKLA